MGISRQDAIERWNKGGKIAPAKTTTVKSKPTSKTGISRKDAVKRWDKGERIAPPKPKVPPRKIKFCPEKEGTFIRAEVDLVFPSRVTLPLFLEFAHIWQIKVRESHTLSEIVKVLIPWNKFIMLYDKKPDIALYDSPKQSEQFIGWIRVIDADVKLRK